MIYLLSIGLRRRVHSDRLVLSDIGRRRVRLVYGQLREQGFDAWSARGIVLDVLMAGSFARYATDPTHAAKDIQAVAS